MKYFFILGRNSTLSIAEISAVFDLSTNKEPTYELLPKNILKLETNKYLNATQMIKKLGGTIKIGEIQSTMPRKTASPAIILNEIKSIIKPREGKYRFGISYYGKTKLNTKALAMEIKKYLHQQTINSRWVTSRQPTLSSVVVTQNKLIDQGVEIIIIEDNNKLLIGQTKAVQPFKELSFRDYGRPSRDDYAGMLPPKLAQIMINLSRTKSSDTVLDPFCGSGTILTEAMLMGFRNLIGSDISSKAINDTKKNIDWTVANYHLSATDCKVYNKNVTELLSFIKPKSINTIITEPYLGPARGKFNINQTIKELEQLYSQSLAEFRKILKPNRRIVMIWPVFAISKNTKFLTPDLNGFKIINPIPKSLQKNKLIKLTNRKTVIYNRPGQKIWREIVVLTQI